MHSVASDFHSHGNLLMLQIKMNALKQQCPFAPSMVICASHCSVGPPEETDKVFSGAEGENNIFSLWRAPTSSADAMGNKKGLLHAALRSLWALKISVGIKKGQSFNYENLKSLCKFSHSTLKIHCIKKLIWEGALCIIQGCSGICLLTSTVLHSWICFSPFLLMLFLEYNLYCEEQKWSHGRLPIFKLP